MTSETQLNEKEDETLSERSSETLLLDPELEVKIAYAGVAITVIGAFLPWASFLGRTLLGIEANGVITLAIGAVVGAVIYSRDWEKRIMGGTAVAGGIVVLIPLGSLTGISSIGVYATIIGGLAMVVAGQSGYRRVADI